MKLKRIDTEIRRRYEKSHTMGNLSEFMLSKLRRRFKYQN